MIESIEIKKSYLIISTWNGIAGIEYECEAMSEKEALTKFHQEVWEPGVSIVSIEEILNW